MTVPVERPAGRRTAIARIAAAIGGGALVGASLPPWGWWPLAPLGIAILWNLLRGRGAGGRFRTTWWFGIGWFAPSMGWMWFLTAPGYLFAVALYATYLGAAAAVVPDGRGRLVALPAALTLAEALRFSFPFGGVPLAGLGISQVAGPLAPAARAGGALALTWVTFQIGAVVGAAWSRRGLRTRQNWSGPAAALAAALAVVVIGAFAPGATGTGERIDVTFVQGGGPQGTRAADTDPRDVFDRHIAATRTLSPGPDLVVWPENVIDVPEFASSPELTEVAAEADRLGVPILVGITEDAPGEDAFLNAQVVVMPDGSVPSRYDKVRRVPFGEYVPLRGLLESLGAPVDQIRRDAKAGTGPAYLDIPEGRLAVVISWEVFFSGRARDGVRHGGLALINPTNGSSYTGTVLQSQQVASSRLRAAETDRWVVQVSPTGFSAFVTPGGDVLDRTGVSEQAVRTRTIELREGRTLAVRLGDAPVIVLAGVALATGLWVRRRSRA